MGLRRASQKLVNLNIPISFGILGAFEEGKSRGRKVKKSAKLIQTSSSPNAVIWRRIQNFPAHQCKSKYELAFNILRNYDIKYVQI